LTKGGREGEVAEHHDFPAEGEREITNAGKKKRAQSLVFKREEGGRKKGNGPEPIGGKNRDSTQTIWTWGRRGKRISR